MVNEIDLQQTLLKWLLSPTDLSADELWPEM